MDFRRERPCPKSQLAPFHGVPHSCHT
jgi:hypothetical protein